MDGLHLVFCDGGKKLQLHEAYGSFKVYAPDREELIESWHTFGDITSNQSEYVIMLKALEWCQENGITDVHVFTDSELLYRHYLGIYACRNEGLRPLLKQLRKSMKKFGKATMFKLPRRQILRVLGH